MRMESVSHDLFTCSYRPPEIRVYENLPAKCASQSSAAEEQCNPSCSLLRLVPETHEKNHAGENTCFKGTEEES